MTETHTTTLLAARSIVKSFGHVQALRGVDFEVRPSEVVALMGDNGAGKSTLVKVLSGAIRPEAGDIVMAGEQVSFASPLDARRAGIETVYQDLSLADTLDPAANLFLGRELRRGGLLGRLGFLDQRLMRQRTLEAFESLRVTVPSVQAPVRDLSGGQRQGVAVARAVTWAKHVLFLDEPTAALGVQQTRNVLDLIRRVRDHGVSVVLISHSVPDVMAVADRVEVLRLGRRVGQFVVAASAAADIVSAIVGATDESDR